MNKRLKINDIKLFAQAVTYVAAVVLLCSCMKWEYGIEEQFAGAEQGLFITNEGNFQYGNASLSFYDPLTRTVENEIFYRANAMKLGDVAQSMVIHNGVGWIVMNNSHVVFAIDIDTYKEVGRITGLTSPRYIHFVSDDKAYVSQIWDNRIFIVDPRTFSITGHIECPGMTADGGSTEQMVQQGRYLYVSCWSYQNKILKIDTLSDTVVDELEVGIQPSSLVLDARGKLWTLTDGGYIDSPYGSEAPRLIRIDTESFTIEREFRFEMGAEPAELQLNGAGDRLYWLDGDVWDMAIESERLPVRPFLEQRETLYYGLTIDPRTGEVYVADAIDYQQQGMIYRYTAAGEKVDEFYVGIIPGAFCWK